MYLVVSLDGVNVSTDGRISVDTAPAVPADKTPVSIQYVGKHNNDFVVQYDIPIGKRMVIQGLRGGAGRSTNGSYIEIRDKGISGTENDVIGVPLFVNGSTNALTLNKSLEASPTQTRIIELIISNDQNEYSAGEIIGYLEDL